MARKASRKRDVRIGDWVGVMMKVTGFHGNHSLEVDGSGLNGTVLRAEAFSAESNVRVERLKRRKR